MENEVCQFLLGKVQHFINLWNDLKGNFGCGSSCQFLLGKVQRALRDIYRLYAKCQFLLGKVQHEEYNKTNAEKQAIEAQIAERVNSY